MCLSIVDPRSFQASDLRQATEVQSELVVHHVVSHQGVQNGMDTVIEVHMVGGEEATVLEIEAIGEEEEKKEAVTRKAGTLTVGEECQNAATIAIEEIGETQESMAVVEHND
jgi:hypothetical protein